MISNGAHTTFLVSFLTNSAIELIDYKKQLLSINSLWKIILNNRFSIPRLVIVESVGADNSVIKKEGRDPQ